MSRTRAEGKQGRARRVWPWMTLGATACAIAAVVAGWRLLFTDSDTCSEMLRSSDPERRKNAAWMAGEHHYWAAGEHIAEVLDTHSEKDADVREAYVYALGQLAKPGDFKTTARLIETDASGYVRQAAWLAAARIDAVACGALIKSRAAASTPAGGDEWDRLGVAQARMHMGDSGDLSTLLEFARSEDADKRVIAARSLYKNVQPILEAAGRWPLAVGIGAGDEWPAELVAEIGVRCKAFDLQAAMTETRRHFDRSAEVRRFKSKITNARDRITRVLFPKS